MTFCLMKNPSSGRAYLNSTTVIETATYLGQRVKANLIVQLPIVKEVQLKYYNCPDARSMNANSIFCFCGMFEL